MTTISAALAVALQLVAQAPAETPTTQTQLQGQASSLAERLARATSLPDAGVIGRFDVDLPASRRQALQLAVNESQADATTLTGVLADAYARHLTEAEMEGALEFFESQIGSSFERKILLRKSDDVTDAEMEAASEFVQTPAGEAFSAKEQAVNQEIQPAIQAYGERVAQRAQTIQCRTTGDCAPFRQ